jgi:inner membrane protein
MASLGHLAVGMAAARARQRRERPSWRSMAGWAALSMLPDADVVGFSLGVRYADPWGHRGAAHSVPMALAVAAVITALAPKLGLARARTGWIATVVLVSHGVLDTMTDGGLGVALLWPFRLTRYFAPWRPIPVSPIGLAFLSPYGMTVAATELALFAPAIAWALGRPRLRRGFVLAWALAAWLLASTDPIRERLLGVALREDTQYTAGFSEPAFRAIAPGQAIADVGARTGEPFQQAWFYFSAEDDADPARMPPCPAVFIEAGRVATEPRALPRHVAACEQAGVRVGMPGTEVTRLLGAPVGICWSFSRSPTRAYYRARVVCFESGRVIDVMHRWERG